MDDDGARDGAPRTAEWSVALGVAALACAVVPVIGDWIAAPLGALALLLGCLGIHVADRDGRRGTWQGLTGALLGVATLGIVLFSVVVAVTHAGPG